MHKKIAVILVIILLSLPVVYKLIQMGRQHSTDALEEQFLEPVLATCDVSKNDFSITNDSMLHYSLKWVNESAGALPVDALAAISKKNKPLFLNLEIWPRQLIKKLDKNVLAALTAGEYDDKIISLAKSLTLFTQPVYINYDPEMEVPLNKYPWQSQSGNQYISSFRHLSILCKKYAPNIKMVWSPSGFRGTEEYWPGADVTDYCSFILDNSPVKADDPRTPFSSVLEMIRRKLIRLRFCDKPVMLLGSSSINKTTFNPQWLQQLSSMVKADVEIYHTPIIPTDTDTSVEKKRRDTALVIGVYDPKLLLANQPLISIEHVFTDLISVENGLFKRNFDSVITRGHDVIVTIEPWKDKYRERDSNILINTLNGQYDKTLERLYQIISNTPHTVYLRWGHEMEIPVTRYPWQMQDPVAYIKAFRYVATFQKPRAGNIRIVWGPAGDRGSVEYWPGEDVVDYVSIAIYGLPDKNINDHTKQLSFTTIFRNKFHRMRFAHRPIFITEFGVKGPEDYKKKWLEDAAYTINKYPEIKGVNYFNFADVPKAWGDAETPDWSITPATFKSFTSLLKDLPKK